MGKTGKSTDITKNKINKKQKFKTIVIPLIVFIVIISVIVVVCVSCAGRGNNHNTTTSDTTVNVGDYILDDEYLKINATDSTLYVGDMVKLTCSAYPESYSLGVNWKSSDTSVLTVTYDGMVTAIKTGMAAITATNGVLSNSIIIQVIEKGETVPEDFPIFNPETPGETTSGNGEGTQESTGTPEPSKEPVTTNPSQETTSANEVLTTPAENESTTVAEPQTTVPPVTIAPPEDETTTDGIEETTEAVPEETTIDSREYILYSLPEFGFTGYINDTFVYEEDGNYLGQAIVEQDFTQIYVMTRTTGFDSSIKEFLKSFFPKGYATVFNKFTNATSDTTFYSDGYKVRAITSPGGGHRQLIIYY